MSETGIERRRWPRIPASSLGDVSAAIVAGPDVRLVDLSRGGALLEASERVPLQSFVRLELTPAHGDTSRTEGRVAWARVSSIHDGRVHYRVAIVFAEPLAELPVPAADSRPQAPEAATGDAPAATDQTAAADVRPRGVLTRFPSSIAPQATKPLSREDSPAVPDPGRRIAGDAVIATLRKELAAATADLASQSALTETLAARLRDSEEIRAAALEQERHARDEERAAFARQLADAAARAHALQAALDTHAQEQQALLLAEQGKYDALAAEFLKTTNEQQMESEQLLEQLTAAQLEQRSRAEHHEAELARHRVEAQRQRAEDEALHRDLAARLEAAETLCADYGAHLWDLQRQTEQLMSRMFSFRLRAEFPKAEGTAAAACEHETDHAQEVA